MNDVVLSPRTNAIILQTARSTEGTVSATDRHFLKGGQRMFNRRGRFEINFVRILFSF